MIHEMSRVSNICKSDTSEAKRQA